MIEKINTTDKTRRKENTTISDQLFKLKKSKLQTCYLSFVLTNTNYAINIQNIINIIDTPNLIYLSHMTPPIIGMQHHDSSFIPVLDFAGYRSNHTNNTTKPKMLVLSESCFRKDKSFGLLVDSITAIEYFKQKDLIRNKQPFDNLMPAYYYATVDDNRNKSRINLLDINDLANQLD